MNNHHVDIVSLTSNYAGCYNDSVDSRTLKERAWKDQDDMTIEWCFTNCARLAYPFYGLEYSKECFCGHEPSPPGVLINCTSPLSCMPCSGNSSQCCGGSEIISVYSVSTSTTIVTIATGPSSSQPNATPTNQSPSQSFSNTEISSPMTSETSAATAITSSTGPLQTNTTRLGESSIYTSPSLSSTSSTMPSHSSPWPEISNSSALGSTTDFGSSSTAGASQTQITLPTSSTEFSSIIISSSAMPVNTSLSSVPTTQPISATVPVQHSSQTYRPSPSTVLSDPDASSNSSLLNSPLPSSGEITDTASSEAVDGGLNRAVIAGAVIGGAALIAVIGFGILFLRKIKKKPDDDDISMVGMPRDEDLPLGMRNGIRRVRGNDD